MQVGKSLNRQQQQKKKHNITARVFQLNGRERKHLINTCSIVFMKHIFDLSRKLDVISAKCAMFYIKHYHLRLFL